MNLADLPWPRIQALAPDTPVIIPIAALEQHGHHLPVFTDSLLLGEVVRRVSARLESKVLFTPLMWLGNSDHHLDFCGTLSAPPRVYLDLLCGLVDNLLFHGFRRIALVNGHGGNDVPGKQAIFEVRQKHRQRDDLLLLMATYWGLGEKPGGQNSDLYQSEMGHACEWETSMILRLAPHLVGDYQNAPVVPPGEPFRPGNRAWITKDRSAPGHIGWPNLATADKGELLFSTFAEDVTRWIERIIAWDGKSWNG
ncbi:MAG: creatininase family protein [Pirellula sp.]